MNRPSIESLTRRLDDATTFGFGEELSKSELLRLLNEAERLYPASDSAEFEYALGGGWVVYTFMLVRGDERKKYYEFAVTRLGRAYELEKLNNGPNAVSYAMRLARLLVDEAVVRDLPRGLALFGDVYSRTTAYEPDFCSYVDGLYKTGEYDEAIRVGLELNRRAIREYPDPTQRPDAPISLVAKAYRAKVKLYKKQKLLSDALEASESLLGTGVATDNDRAIHQKLADSLSG